MANCVFQNPAKHAVTGTTLPGNCPCNDEVTVFYTASLFCFDWITNLGNLTGPSTRRLAKNGT